MGYEDKIGKSGFGLQCDLSTVYDRAHNELEHSTLCPWKLASRKVKKFNKVSTFCDNVQSSKIPNLGFIGKTQNHHSHKWLLFGCLRQYKGLGLDPAEELVWKTQSGDNQLWSACVTLGAKLVKLVANTRTSWWCNFAVTLHLKTRACVGSFVNLKY